MQCVARTILLLLLLFGAGIGRGSTGAVALVATTTVENSGLLARLVQGMEAELPLRIHAFSMGTGQALSSARLGEVDVLIVHDPAAEQRFVAEGYAARREALMHNHFLLVGPASNPAGVHASDATSAALNKLFASRDAVFVSRGDESGTHEAEKRLWKTAGLDPFAMGARYRRVGSGMGRTLLIAYEIDAYTLVDRATFAYFGRKAALKVLLGEEGRPELLNRYSVIVVRHPARSIEEAANAARAADWLLGQEGQRTIADYRINGRSVFVPEALAHGARGEEAQ